MVAELVGLGQLCFTSLQYLFRIVYQHSGFWELRFVLDLQFVPEIKFEAYIETENHIKTNFITVVIGQELSFILVTVFIVLVLQDLHDILRNAALR